MYCNGDTGHGQVDGGRVRLAAVAMASLLVVTGGASGGTVAPGYAVEAVWIPGEFDAGVPWPQSPGDPLGEPDFDVLGDAYGIGRRGDPPYIGIGILTLDMGVLFSDGPGDDLMVWEYGTTMGGTNDPYEVSVGDAAGVFTEVGSSLGDPMAFDLASVAASGPFRYVRVFDADTTGKYDGADIDAVKVCHIVPLPPAAFLGIVGLGLAGWLKRRHAKVG